MTKTVKYILIFDAIVFVFLIALGYHFFFPKHSVHYHAGFQVYQDNILVDFSGLKYMNLVPCGEHDEAKDAQHEQQEKAHLHDNIGDVVHSHRNGAVWGDLFQNIGYSPTSSVEGYVDGIKTPNILQHPIRPNESVTFFIGNNENIEEKLNQRVRRERIMEVDQMSENCAVNK